MPETIVQIEDHVRSLLTQGKKEDAYALAEEAAKETPHSVELLKLLGHVALKMGKPRMAFDSFRKAIDLGANDIELYRWLLILCCELPEHGIAELYGPKGLELHPADPTIQCYWGLAAFRLKPSEDAIDRMRIGIAGDPNQWGSFYAGFASAMTSHGRTNEAISDLIRAARSLGASEDRSSAHMSVLFQLAYLLRNAQQVHALREVLKQLLSKNPTHAKSLLDLLFDAYEESAPSVDDTTSAATAIANLLTQSPNQDHENVSPTTLVQLVARDYRFFSAMGLDSESERQLVDLGLSKSFLDFVRNQGALTAHTKPSSAWHYAQDASPRVKDILDTLNNRAKETISPFSGSTVSSTHMLAAECFLFSDNSIPFIVAQWSETDDPFGDNVWIVPHLQLVVYVHRGFTQSTLQKFTASLFLDLMENREAVTRHLATKNEQIVVSQPLVPHIGHYVWNAVSGWSPLFRYASLQSYPDGVGIYSNVSMLGDVSDLYPESAQRIAAFHKFGNVTDVNHFIWNNAAMVLTIKHNYVSDDLASRVVRRCYRLISGEFEEAARSLRSKCFPLLLITIRLDNRSWVEQESGWIALINELSGDFPSLGVVIDGINANVTQGWTHLSMSVEAERTLSKSIAAACKVPTFDSIGCSIEESIVLGDLADAFVAPVGAGMAKYRWINNLPGVAFSNTTFSDADNLHGHLYDYYREYARKAVHVSQEAVRDVPTNSSEVSRANFSLDWRDLYAIVKEHLSTLQRPQVPRSA